MAGHGPDCYICGGSLRRKHRSLPDRLRYSAIYRCQGCGEKMAIPRRYLYLFRLYTCCPRCGNTDLRRLLERDGVDELYGNPISRLQRFLGAPLYWCHLCRLQFYDFRPSGRNEPAAGK